MKIIVIDDLAYTLSNIGKALEILGHNCVCILTREKPDEAMSESDLRTIEQAIQEFQPDLYFLDEGCHPLGGVIAHRLGLPRDRVVGTTSGEVNQRYAFAQLSMKEKMNTPEFEPAIAAHILGFLLRHKEHLSSLGLQPLEVRGVVRHVELV